AHWLRGRPPTPRLRIARAIGVGAISSGSAPSPICRPESIPAELKAASTRDMVRIDETSPDLAILTGLTENNAAHPGHARLEEQHVPGSDVGSLDPPNQPQTVVDESTTPAAWEEELGLLGLLEGFGTRVERLPALRHALRRAFEEGSFDLLHLVSHGTFGGS